MQILNTVEKSKVATTKSWMNKYLTVAGVVNIKADYLALEKASLNLEHAKGLYQALSELQLLTPEEIRSAQNDIGRIDNKIRDIRREKQDEIYSRHHLQGERFI